MTKMVMSALKAAQEAQKAEWEGMSWGGGIVRAEDLSDALKELRVRHDAYGALLEMTIDDVKSWMGIEDDE